MNFEFPLLSKDQISVKVKQVTKSGAVALLYKSARVDMDMLDSVVGQEGWQCDYREIHGNLYCGIAIRAGDEWIWKWDCGIESAQSDGNEKKAEASDAFKRAGFRWGIGRELYTSPFIFLNVQTEESGRGFKLKDAFARFEVSKIEYSDKRITALEIVNTKTKAAVFTTGASRPNQSDDNSPGARARAAIAAGEKPVTSTPPNTATVDSPTIITPARRITAEQLSELKRYATPEDYAACEAKYGKDCFTMTANMADRLIAKAKGKATA